MIVSIENKHEKILCDGLAELSKYDEKNIKAVCFMILTTDDIITIGNAEHSMDLGIMAANLSMRANNEFFREQLEVSPLMVTMVEDDDDEDCEDDD